MTLINFSNIFVLSIWILLFIVLNVLGFVKKSSWFNLATLVVSLIFLILHVTFRVEFVSNFRNMVVDFIFIIISVSLYLYVDDIEARRQVISEVFENKYKKK